MRRTAGFGIQISEEEHGGHGKTNADECVVERCDDRSECRPSSVSGSRGDLRAKGDQDTSATGIQMRLA